MKKFRFVLLALCLLCLCSACGRGLTVPNIINVDEETAKTAVAAMGLVPDMEAEYAYGVPAGHVTRCKPAIGNAVAPGARVKVYVSKGVSPTKDPEGAFLCFIKEKGYENTEVASTRSKLQSFCICDVDADKVPELLLQSPGETETNLFVYKVDKETDTIVGWKTETILKDKVGYAEKADGFYRVLSDGRIVISHYTEQGEEKLREGVQLTENLYRYSGGKGWEDCRGTRAEMDAAFGEVEWFVFRDLSTLR